MRLIDADKLQELCNKMIAEKWNSRTVPVSWAEAYADFKDDIDSIPTIDPESLRPRGTWEGTADGYADGELVYDTWTCSECGYTVDTDDPDDLTKFCPNCGAKMEGGHNP